MMNVTLCATWDNLDLALALSLGNSNEGLTESAMTMYDVYDRVVAVHDIQPNHRNLW